MIRKTYKNVDEVVYKTTLKNKMKVVLLSKKGFSEKDCYMVVKFGHFDNVRNIRVNGKTKRIPLGSAHFLEHRMFSINDTDASDLFSALGASSNAYTTYDKTVYQFSTQEHFYECLQVLLDMMDGFTSTEKQIENEKKIILQEAAMYDEEPRSVLNKKLLEDAYLIHPINEDIIGTKKSVNETTKDELEAVYNTFYDPSNLTLVVCGNVNPDELEEYLNNHLLKVKNPKRIKPLSFDEPFRLKEEYKEVVMPTISNKRNGILLKLKVYKDKKKRDVMFSCYDFILSYLFSGSGVLNEAWLKEKIITTSLTYGVVSEIDLDHIIFYNVNDNVLLIEKKLKEYFKSHDTFEISDEDFNNLKKSFYGSILRDYESVSELIDSYVYQIFDTSFDFFREIEFINSITKEDLNEAFHNIAGALYSIVVVRRN